MNKKLKISLLLISLVLLISFSSKPLRWQYKPIKVGILHSLTGTMAISEKSLVKACLLAIKELNESGGLLDRKIQAIIADGKSDNAVFASEAERLIVEENVDAIFGCWTSACRKTIKPIVEKHQHIFFYPVQYEGLEQSPHIVYTGATPNQQIVPAIRWALKNLGKRLFLIGSDYVFPHAANQIIQDVVKNSDAHIVDEQYIPLGSKNIQPLIEKIIKTQPSVIINTLNGDSNIEFFERLYAAGITADKSPVLSFSINETELQHLNINSIQGHYAAWNYFQSLDSIQNQEFVKIFKREYGADSVTSDPIQSSYFSIHLWAQAVKVANSTTPKKVLKTIKNQGYKAPEGIVMIDSTSLHTWKTTRIGKINKDGQFTIVWSSINATKPAIYPKSRTQQQWQSYLQSLFTNWKGDWEKQQ